MVGNKGGQQWWATKVGNNGGQQRWATKVGDAVWSPPLLSATPLGTVSGMSCDLCVGRLAAKDACMCRTFLEECDADHAMGSCE